MLRMPKRQGIETFKYAFPQFCLFDLKMRKGVLVLVLALALVIAGCKGGEKGTASSSTTPFIGGTEGLRISFLENAPPRETLDNPKAINAKGTPETDRAKWELSKFDIAMRVENVGEQKILADTLTVTIGGIYAGDFNVGADKTITKTTSLTSSLAKELEGVRKDPEGERLPGGVDEIIFADLAYVKSLEGNNEFPIQADACYPYRTRAVADFCMRKDLTKATSGVCQIKGSKPVFSSGGPIQVTSFEEAVGGTEKVILKFKIKATGAGTFYKPGDCKKGNFQEENFVRVTVASGVSGLKCSGWDSSTKDVRLTNGEASVTCIQSGVTVDALQKMNIYLDYNHLITASTKILVKHLPTDAASSGTPCGSGEVKQTDGTCKKATGGSGCTYGASDDTCKTSDGKTGTRVCKTDGTWTPCVYTGGTF